MRLLVTGGAGFIGSNFVHYWLANHPWDEVAVLDKLTYAGNKKNLAHVADQKNFQFYEGDIANPIILNTIALRGIDVIVHFAAETHVDNSLLRPADFINTNVLGTQMLLEAAIRHKVKRFHLISTDEVFGALPLEGDSKFNEETPYAPRNPYSASKASADHLVRAYGISYGLPITITNCSNNYGPYQFPEKLLPLAITNLLEGKKVPVYGDGQYVRDWLYVEDHCRAIEEVLIRGKAGETYCVGGLTEDITNIDLIKRVLALMGKTENDIEYVKDRPGHDRRYTIDWSKINKELGWKPKFELDEYLKKTIDWYAENEEWWKPLKKGGR
jgi:dTDP-glucose 4,6-dehydratase